MDERVMRIYKIACSSQFPASAPKKSLFLFSAFANMNSVDIYYNSFFDQRNYADESLSSAFDPRPIADHVLSKVSPSPTNNNVVQEEDESSWDEVFDVLDTQPIDIGNYQQHILSENDMLQFMTFPDDELKEDSTDIRYPNGTPSSSSCCAAGGLLASSGKRSAALPFSEPLHPKKKQRYNFLSTTSATMLEKNSQQHEGKWESRFQELVAFLVQHGHCCVPTRYEENPSLAQWVKRQRYQYRLLQLAKPSSMTSERQASLEQLGFIWDLHDAVWEERLNDDLFAFKQIHGHCKIPLKYPANPELAIWAKCQRRHFVEYCNTVARGKEWKSNTMTMDRILKLAKMGFVFSNRSGHQALDALQLHVMSQKQRQQLQLLQQHSSHNIIPFRAA
jgi:Helicase associated domain